MPRPAITPSQRILDLFAAMETPAMKALLEKMQEMYGWAVKRDARVAKPPVEGSPVASAPVGALCDCEYHTAGRLP